MSTLKEKYLGEALLSEKPKKKLSLKIADRAITPEHLSDRVMDEVITPSLDALKETIYENTVRKGEETNADWNSSTGEAQILNKPNINSSNGTTTIHDDAEVDIYTGELLTLSRKYNNEKFEEIAISPAGIDVNVPNGKKFWYNRKEVATKDNIPAYTSQLSNDSGYVSMSAVQEVVVQAMDLLREEIAGKYVSK